MLNRRKNCGWWLKFFAIRLCCCWILHQVADRVKLIHTTDDNGLFAGVTALENDNDLYHEILTLENPFSFFEKIHQSSSWSIIHPFLHPFIKILTLPAFKNLTMTMKVSGEKEEDYRHRWWLEYNPQEVSKWRHRKSWGNLLLWSPKFNILNKWTSAATCLMIYKSRQPLHLFF